MATSTANLAQSRTRSLRAPPTGGLKLSSALNPPTGSGPSNLTLFLTNVRLLDLDLRKDWPDITLAVLTSKDAKKRIQCVEWALYQLFVLWDPEEARNKLQPFYPPLEPLQSLNLRAALYRCLDQAKKNGVLGRDTVLRKTMLDECKGERLEEVLAVFSNAVLQRKVQEATTGPYQAIAQQLASENFSYSGERTILSALILTHKASISKHLQDKNNSRAKYHDFAELLNLNQRRASRRHEQLKESIEEGGPQTKLSRREVGELHEKFQKNWGGNSEWTESILYGDCSDGKDGLLATRFQDVWEHVEKGTIGDLEGKRHAGLLEQLDARVKDQAERLAKWQDFGKTLAKKDASPKKRDPPAAKGNAKIDLGFTKHEALQVRGKVVDAADAAPLQEDYARMLENMKAELANVGKPQPKNTRVTRRSLPLQGRRTSSCITSPIAPSSAASSPIAEKEPAAKEDDGWSSASSDSEVVSPGFKSYGSKSLSRTPPSEIAHDNTAITAPDTAPLPKVKTIPLDTESENEDNTFNAVPAPRRTELRHRVRSPATEIRPQPITTQPISDLDTELESEDDTTRVASTPRNIEPPRLRTPPAELRPKSITSPDPGNDELADQILNSMAAASPSPKKPRHKLSLAERTRLSMARASHTEVSDLHDDFDLPRLSLRPKLTPPIKSPDIDPHADLIERTRKSMAGFEAAQKKAQLDRRRSVKAEKKRQRESGYFPKVKEPSLREEDESKFEDLSILIEGEDPDYEDVFKSRPKIATTPLAMSPAVSPAKSWGAESVMSEDGML